MSGRERDPPSSTCWQRLTRGVEDEDRAPNRALNRALTARSGARTNAPVSANEPLIRNLRQQAARKPINTKGRAGRLRGVQDGGLQGSSAKSTRCSPNTMASWKRSWISSSTTTSSTVWAVTRRARRNDGREDLAHGRRRLARSRRRTAVRRQGGIPVRNDDIINGPCKGPRKRG